MAQIDQAQLPIPEQTLSGTAYLVDDNDGFRKSTAWLLEAHGLAVKTFASANEFLAFLDIGSQRTATACLILDVRMPGMNGLELQDALMQRGEELPIVFMSGHADIPLAVEAMRKGAMNFLEKPFTEEALIDAVKAALKAKTSLSSSHRSDPEAKARLASLTNRERQVLELVLEGKLNKTTADILNISIKTVELHRARVMSKMQAKSLAHLVQLAVAAR
jgi:two-component system, LuxR family, response regulator FixJ